MAKLKLGPVTSDKPVKVTIELPGALHRGLLAYAQVLAQETGQPVGEAVKLIVPMLERFIATDRAFAKARREVECKSQPIVRVSHGPIGPSTL